MQYVKPKEVQRFGLKKGGRNLQKSNILIKLNLNQGKRKEGRTKCAILESMKEEKYTITIRNRKQQIYNVGATERVNYTRFRFSDEW